MQGDDQPPLTQADWSSLLSIFQQPQQAPQPQAPAPMPPPRPKFEMPRSPAPMGAAPAQPAPTPPPRPANLTPSPYGSLQPPNLPDNSANPEMALALSRQPQSPNYVPPAPSPVAQAQPQGDQSGMLMDLVKRGLISPQAIAGMMGRL